MKTLLGGRAKAGSVSVLHRARTRRSTRVGGERALAAAVLVFSVDASAQAPPEAAAAEALFREARELVAAGKIADACPKFAESQRLDPAPGTLLNLGDCFERSGRVASAWVAYQDAAVASLRAGLHAQAADAASLARDLEEKLPKLVIRVGPASAVANLTVRRDRVEVPPAQWGTSIPLDPGAYQISAAAPGRASFVETVVLPLASRGTLPTVVEIPLLRTDHGHDGRESPPAHAHKTIAVATTATGLAAVAVGAVTGVLALARDGAARDAGCDDRTCWTPRGRELTVQARDLAAASSWLFVGGAALFGTGAVLWWTAPPSTPARPAAGATMGVHVPW